MWEGVGENITATFWPLLLWLSALCLSCSPGAQPDAQRPSSPLDDGFLYCILAASSLDPNSSGPQAPSACCGFPNHISSTTPSPTVTGTATVAWLLSWLSYIIVQRPLDRPLDLWNGMIDRHPAEISVMQFTGHSLPVHQSMSVSWALPCPISSAKSTHAISFVTAIRMCHFLPVHHLRMAFLAGLKVRIQHKCIAAEGDYFEGEESFMCVLSIKMPIWKMSGNLFNDPRVYQERREEED